MTIILKENEWAKEAIDKKELGKKPTETLRRVARYYIDLGYNEKEARDMTEAFILQCDPAVSLVKWSKTIDYVMKNALKYEAVDIDYIGVSQTELDKVSELKSVMERRLMFTLLCLSKYWMKINPDMDYWVVNKDNDIMKMANIKTSTKRQCLLYYNIKEAGMIEFSKKVDNTNVRVCIVDDDELVMKVTDFRNLGYQYLMFNGGNYFECENCGIVTKITGDSNKRNQKYCKECSTKMYIEQHVNAAMRYRDRSKKCRNLGK